MTSIEPTPAAHDDDNLPDVIVKNARDTIVQPTFETPPGAFARPDRGWLQPADWSFVYWQLLCARARALATLGEKERALDDAVEALAINLLGTELDYARMVSSADSALKTASLLAAGVEPEEGPLGW